MKKKFKTPLMKGVLSLALMALGIFLYPETRGEEMFDLIWRSIASGWSITIGTALFAATLLSRRGENKS